MDEHVETEFTLRALHAIEPAAMDAAIRETGFTCRAIDSRRNLDVYLDDAHRSLLLAGHGLRLRDDGRRRTLTCKSDGRRDGALFVRTEIESRWNGPLPPTTASELPAELRDAVEPFVLDRSLGEVLRLAIDRETRFLQCDGREVCAVMLDRVEGSCRDRTASFVEIEIEVADELPACERLARAFVDRLPVRASDDDKPTHAAALLGQHVEAIGPADLNADALTGEVLEALLRKHLANALRAEAGVRTGRDPAHLHAMRVSVRRLRGLVRAFRDAWAENDAKFALDHLGDTSRRLGALRDFDVTIAATSSSLESLPEALRPATARLVPWMQARRDVLHVQIRDWLRSASRLAQIRRVGELFAATGAGEVASTPLRTAFESRIEKLVANAQKLATALPHELPFAPSHEFRIAVKRLRYFAEEFAALAPDGIRKSLAASIRLQSDLGQVCDHEQAMQLLNELIAPAAAVDEAPALVAAALGGLATLHAVAGIRARKRAWRSLQRFDRPKVWRRFRE